MNKIKYLVTISLVFALTGCDSFLDLSPISQANENAFYKTEDDIETAMWSAYATLHNIYAPEGLPSYYGDLCRITLTATTHLATSRPKKLSRHTSECRQTTLS